MEPHGGAAPTPTRARRGLGGRGGFCWDAGGVAGVPLCLPGCGARRGRLCATPHLLALQGHKGKRLRSIPCLFFFPSCFAVPMVNKSRSLISLQRLHPRGRARPQTQACPLSSPPHTPIHARVCKQQRAIYCLGILQKSPPRSINQRVSFLTAL